MTDRKRFHCFTRRPAFCGRSGRRMCVDHFAKHLGGPGVHRRAVQEFLRHRLECARCHDAPHIRGRHGGETAGRRRAGDSGLAKFPDQGQGNEPAMEAAVAQSGADALLMTRLLGIDTRTNVSTVMVPARYGVPASVQDLVRARLRSWARLVGAVLQLVRSAAGNAISDRDRGDDAVRRQDAPHRVDGDLADVQSDERATGSARPCRCGDPGAAGAGPDREEVAARGGGATYRATQSANEPREVPADLAVEWLRFPGHGVEPLAVAEVTFLDLARCCAHTPRS